MESGAEGGTRGGIIECDIVLMGVGDRGEASLGHFFLGVEVEGVFVFVEFEPWLSSIVMSLTIAQAIMSIRMRKEVTRIIFLKLIRRSAKYNDSCIWTNSFQSWGVVLLVCVKPKSEGKCLKSGVISGLYLYLLTASEMLGEFSNEKFPSREIDKLWTLTACKSLCNFNNSGESQIHWR